MHIFPSHNISSNNNNNIIINNNNHNKYISFVPLNKQFPSPFMESSSLESSCEPSHVSLYYLSYLFDVNQEKSLFYHNSCYTMFKSFALLLCDVVLSKEDKGRPINENEGKVFYKNINNYIDFRYGAYKRQRKYTTMKRVKIRKVEEEKKRKEMKQKQEERENKSKEEKPIRYIIDIKTLKERTKRAMTSKEALLKEKCDKRVKEDPPSQRLFEFPFNCNQHHKLVPLQDGNLSNKCTFDKKQDFQYQELLASAVYNNCTLHFNSERDVFHYDKNYNKFKIMSYYNKRYSSGSSCYSNSFVDESARYGHHIQKMICNRFRDAGIKVYDPIRVVCENFTSNPDALLYIKNFVNFNDKINMIPLEIKSTYIGQDESKYLMEEGISVSHVFQMLTHCYVHNSEVCIYFHYHRITGSHKMMIIYDKEHQYWKQITRIMNLSKKMQLEQVMELLKEECNECEAMLSKEMKLLVLSIIKKRREIKNIQKSRYRCESHNNMINTKEMEEIILKGIQQLSFSCVLPIYYHNNITNNTHFFEDKWSQHLNPPYNQQYFWKKLSTYFI